MAKDETIEARTAAVYELFRRHEEDLTHGEIRQSFHTLRSIVRDMILEMGEAFGLRERLEFYLDAFEQTVVILRDMEAEELSKSN